MENVITGYWKSTLYFIIHAKINRMQAFQILSRNATYIKLIHNYLYFTFLKQTKQRSLRIIIK